MYGLEGGHIDYLPQYAREDRTFKKAPKAERETSKQRGLPLVAESDAGYSED
jgi:hypothetical protein